MTNKEMIKDLSRIMDLLDMHIDLNQSLNITQMEVAYLTIKCIVRALGQQPCEDCISREEALKVMCEKCPMYNCVTGCSSYRHIEKMPSVTPQVESEDEATKAFEMQLNRCDSCIHSEERDGSNCYECVKGMADNFEAQPCEDCISRESVRQLICENNDKYGYSDRFHEFTAECLQLPSVTSKQNVGKWIKTYEPNDAEPCILWMCSECQNTERGRRRSKYCPNCGAKMEVE